MGLRRIHIGQQEMSRDALRWSSILSATSISMGSGLAFLLLGNAIGLSASNAVDPAVGGVLRFFSWVYVAFMTIASFYIGNAVAARSRLNAAVAWGLTSVLGITILGSLNPTAMQLFDGTAPNSANWLSLCVVVFGLGAAVLGGVQNETSFGFTSIEERERERPAA